MSNTPPGREADPPALTVGQLIAELSKLDPSLPVWTRYFDELVPARRALVDDFGWGSFVELDEWGERGGLGVASRIPLDRVVTDPAVVQEMLSQ